MAKHTPAPWEVGGPWPTISVIYQTDAGSTHPEWTEPPGYDVVCCLWLGLDSSGRMKPEHPDRERKFADAKLIAAAPELLAACRLALATLKPSEEDDEPHPMVVNACDAIRAAIAKAEG